MVKASASLRTSWTRRRPTPRRMTTADYRAAVARTPHGPQRGRLTEAPGDPELAEHGATVVEELVADVLLTDLAEATRFGARVGSA